MNVNHNRLQRQKILIDNQPQNMFFEDMDSFVFEERALLLAGKGDIVVLREPLPQEYIDFIKGDNQFEIIMLDTDEKFADLSDVILNEKNIEIIRKKIDSTSCKDNLILHAYIPDEKVDLIANELGVKVCGKKFFYENYKKSIIKPICSELGLNNIQGIYINKIEDLSSEKTHDFVNTYKRIVIKPDVGLGGQATGTYNETDFKADIKQPVFPALLQEFLPVQLEGSIQFFCDAGAWRIYCCETIQNNFKFKGFKFPCRDIRCYEVLSEANRLLEYFVAKYGNDMSSFGIDFIISNEKVYFHDINPRNTAVTYIFSLCHHLYDAKRLNKLQCMYLQIEYDSFESYMDLCSKIEHCGLIHISKDNVEGYALLYPGMLKMKILNILLVSESDRVDEYLKLIYQAIE